MSLESGLGTAAESVEHGLNAVAHSPVTAKILFTIAQVALPIAALFVGYKYVRNRWENS